MPYRWALLLTLVMLSSSDLPTTAWGQSQRADPAADDRGGDAPQPAGGESLAGRFAAKAAQARMTLPDSPARPPKRSVLEPSTSRWLEDDAGRPLASVSDDLGPANLLSSPPCPSGLAPEAMLDDLPSVRGNPSTILDPSTLPPSMPPTFFDRMPRVPPRKQPMMRESWLFRPFNVSFFEGALFAAPPITPQFRTSTGYFTGFRIGWDFAAHFGGETRFGFSKVDMLEAPPSTLGGYQKIFYFDSNLLIYPWGDTRWRPFLSIGGGLADNMIVANNGNVLHPDTFNMPLGGGIKYRFGSRVAFRADVRDNLTFSGSGGVRTLNNVEVLGGIEFHFGGGDRRNYWPWNPSKHWW